MNIRIATLLVLVLCCNQLRGQQPELSPWNGSAPFAYVVGGKRSWPILNGNAKNARVRFSAKVNGKQIGPSASLKVAGLHVYTSGNRMHIESTRKANLRFSMTVELAAGGQTQRQTVQVQPAPPNRPISYVADLVDDLIRVFYHHQSGKFQPIRKGGLDQYFRRLQAQGIARLIVWQSPFAYSVDPKFLNQEDWRRYRLQSEAILGSAELNKVLSARKLHSWKWINMTMQLRLTPDFGRMLNASAKDHGIPLTASFRPFEPALTKYYEIPTFDNSGRFLWGFLPMAWPAVNYHPQDLCFANCRMLLRRLKRPREAEVDQIEFTKTLNAADIQQQNLRLFAASFPPIDRESFVLVRQSNGRFKLQRYATIEKQTLRHRQEITGFKVDTNGDAVRISGLSGKIPAGCRFLIIARRGKHDMIAAPLGHPIVVRATAGNRLGRVNPYRVLDESDPQSALTRLAGITADGGFRTTFYTVENNVDKLGFSAGKDRLKRCSVVIDLGDDWSVETLDFQRAATRRMALDQVRMLMSHSSFDEIFINTRSHTQLAAATADRYEAKGPVQPIENYRLRRQNYHHLGLDMAFCPISLAQRKTIQQLAANPRTVEQITNWQDDAWNGACQSADSPFIWRYERNRAVAQGLRLLYEDLSKAFPRTRIRAVFPQSEKVERATRRGLVTMKKPQGGVYGEEYYRHIWSSNNHIPKIGEGAAMVNLTGLRIEPVFLGIRYMPADGPLDLFLREWFRDMADNKGSSFRGPKSFFYEAQETLRVKKRAAADKRRHAIIRKLLSHKDHVNEVLLYEAADWTYYIPLNDPHKYVEQQPKQR